jgi:formylmethanofuran dehydrogenase subunit E
MALEKEDIMALIAILQKGLEEEEPKTHKSMSKKTTRQRKSNVTKQKQEKQNINKFLSMPEKDMHKADTAIDKKLAVVPPTDRTRQYNPVSVRCRVCGKEEKINPRYLEAKDRYKCNKCSTSAG